MRDSLIQKGKCENMGYGLGIFSLVRFNNENAGRFVLGSHSRSIGRIRVSLRNYVYNTVTLKDKVITVFYRNEESFNIKFYLQDIAKNTRKLPDQNELHDYIFDPNYNVDDVNFWWDVENDIIFWKLDPAFEAQFRALISYE